MTVVYDKLLNTELLHSHGDSGGAGEPGGDSFSWSYDNTTTPGDPGSGKLRLDSTDLSLAENIYIDPLDINGVDLTTWLVSIDTPLKKGSIKIFKKSSPINFVVFNLSDLSDETGYYQISGANASSNGSFTNGDELVVTFAPSGQDGISFVWTGAWGLDSEYITYRVASNNGSSYLCTSAHTATADDEPGVGVNWTDYWSVMAQGVEAGGALTHSQLMARLSIGF